MTVLLEPWLTKADLAGHLGCSTRSIDLAVADGMPHAIIFGRRKFRASDVEAWLEATGHLQRRGSGVAPERQEAA